MKVGVGEMIMNRWCKLKDNSKKLIEQRTVSIEKRRVLLLHSSYFIHNTLF